MTGLGSERGSVLAAGRLTRVRGTDADPAKTPTDPSAPAASRRTPFALRRSGAGSGAGVLRGSSPRGEGRARARGRGGSDPRPPCRELRPARGAPPPFRGPRSPGDRRRSVRRPTGCRRDDRPVPGSGGAVRPVRLLGPRARCPATVRGSPRAGRSRGSPSRHGVAGADHPRVAGAGRPTDGDADSDADCVAFASDSSAPGLADADAHADDHSHDEPDSDSDTDADGDADSDARALLDADIDADGDPDVHAAADLDAASSHASPSNADAEAGAADVDSDARAGPHRPTRISRPASAGRPKRAARLPPRGAAGARAGTRHPPRARLRDGRSSRDPGRPDGARRDDGGRSRRGAAVALRAGDIGTGSRADVVPRPNPVRSRAVRSSDSDADAAASRSRRRIADADRRASLRRRPLERSPDG
jgi:hypothetical protein